jgi:uncharacterized membrane protein YgcG
MAGPDETGRRSSLLNAKLTIVSEPVQFQSVTIGHSSNKLQHGARTTMKHSITQSLFAAILIALAISASAQAAKVIQGQNIKTLAAACDRSPKCINWGGGVFTNGGTGGAICNEKKCVSIPDDSPTRAGSNDNRGNDPSGSSVNAGGGNGGGKGTSSGGNQASDGGPSID